MHECECPDESKTQNPSLPTTEANSSSGSTAAISTFGQRLKQYLREPPSPTSSISDAKSEIIVGRNLRQRFGQGWGPIGRDTSGTTGSADTWYRVLSRATCKALSMIVSRFSGASVISAALTDAPRASESSSSSQSQASEPIAGASKSKESPRASSDRVSWPELGEFLKWVAILLSGTVAAVMLLFYKKLDKKKEPLDREESRDSSSKNPVSIATEMKPKEKGTYQYRPFFANNCVRLQTPADHFWSF